jgi:zinc protease
VTRLTLSNGVQAVLKPTDFKNDEILFAAQSPGGTSRAPEDAYIPAAYAATLVGQSGVGMFGPIALQKKLAGKVVRLSPYIGELSEGFSGAAAPSDVETLLQLVHLFFTAPRADSVAYASFKTRIGDLIASMKADPGQAFRDTLQVTLSQHHPRRQPFTEATLDQMDLAESYAFFQDRFADASDFTFYFVGNFDVASFTPLLETYLGSLPAVEREDTWRDVGVRTPEGVIEKAVYKGIEPKSQVQLVFSGPFEWSLENRRALSALTDVLNIRLREVLREDLSGTYGVSVDAARARVPEERYRIDISFGCDPERVDELTATVFAQIDSLQAHGASEIYLTKVRETDLRSYQENLKENRFWLASLQFYDEHGEEPIPLKEGPEAFLQRLSSEMIREAAQTYLDADRYVKVVLYPEGFQEEAAGGSSR